jgi:glycosyltransferase involved in cell wall biosynthesis
VLPDIELHLIGSRMPDSILALARTPGIRVHGFIEDLEPFLNRARISLAPLRYGAGVKGKVNQAMAHGLPVVATPCAAEGMFLEDGQDVLIAGDAQGFADAVIRLDQDEALWNRLARGGLANVEAHFSRPAADAVLAGLEKTDRAASGLP